MIADNSIISSVWSMDNSLPDVSDIFSFSRLDLIESDWSPASPLENRFCTRELESSEECDSLFNLGMDDESLNDDLLDAVNSMASSVQCNYLYEIDSNLLNQSPLQWEEESVSSSQTNLSDSMNFDLIDVCDDSQASSSESEFKHWKDIINSHIQWSRLTSTEQESVIWGLAEYIITLSPRERGDIMKILNPDIKLSHINALTLFDSSLFTDRKFELIRNYLKNHTPSSDRSKSTHKTSTDKTSTDKTSTHKTSTKKRSKKQKIDPLMKMAEQAVKEKESGLFQKEIVVSLSTPEAAEEEDIDIDIIG